MAKLFELGRLSGSQAARMSGTTRLEFLRRLDRIGVPAINLRDEEIDEEIRAARDRRMKRWVTNALRP